MLTANIFALMGLRQLYFLIGGLLERLVFLSYGLAFLLGFIGVKLVLHALHANELPFVNGGRARRAGRRTIPIWLSLAGDRAARSLVTTAASLVRSRCLRPAPPGRDVGTLVDPDPHRVRVCNAPPVTAAPAHGETGTEPRASSVLAGGLGPLLDQVHHRGCRPGW